MGWPASCLPRSASWRSSPRQINRFLPPVVEFLKGKLPSDLMRKITDLLPASMAGAVH
jgi:hypothetical protein